MDKAHGEWVLSSTFEKEMSLPVQINYTSFACLFLKLSLTITAQVPLAKLDNSAKWLPRHCCDCEFKQIQYETCA